MIASIEKGPEAIDAVFALMLHEQGLPMPVRELKFHPDRKWRFDYAWPEQMICLEVEGGRRQYGRHNRPQGFANDVEKYNAATVFGWRVLRCFPETLRSKETVLMLRAMFERVNA